MTRSVRARVKSRPLAVADDWMSDRERARIVIDTFDRVPVPTPFQPVLDQVRLELSETSGESLVDRVAICIDADLMDRVWGRVSHLVSDGILVWDRVWDAVSTRPRIRVWSQLRRLPWDELNDA